MRIFWVTRLRGFLKHMSHKMSGVEFVENKGYYETNSLVAKLKSKIIRSRILNPSGIFQILLARDEACDC